LSLHNEIKKNISKQMKFLDMPEVVVVNSVRAAIEAVERITEDGEGASVIKSAGFLNKWSHFHVFL
jgi:hypothetical protein